MTVYNKKYLPVKSNSEDDPTPVDPDDLIKTKYFTPISLGIAIALSLFCIFTLAFVIAKIFSDGNYGVIQFAKGTIASVVFGFLFGLVMAFVYNNLLRYRYM